MKIAIGGDRCGFDYKMKLVKYLEENDYEVKDTVSPPHNLLVQH